MYGLAGSSITRAHLGIAVSVPVGIIEGTALCANVGAKTSSLVRKNNSLVVFKEVYNVLLHVWSKDT